MPRNHENRPTTLEEKIDRLASLSDIRELPHRYGLAVDTRNLDDLMELFVEDVRVGRDKSGRAALKEWFGGILANFQTSIHFVGNHIIDFESPDRAKGVVYCHDELDRSKDDWGVGYIQYWDDYERRDGIWYFARRRLHRWYMVDAVERPFHGAGVATGGGASSSPQLPDAWPSWAHYWNEVAPKKG